MKERLHAARFDEIEEHGQEVDLLAFYFDAQLELEPAALIAVVVQGIVFARVGAERGVPTRVVDDVAWIPGIDLDLPAQFAQARHCRRGKGRERVRIAFHAHRVVCIAVGEQGDVFEAGEFDRAVALENATHLGLTAGVTKTSLERERLTRRHLETRVVETEVDHC